MSVKNALIATLNMLKRMERKVVYKDINIKITNSEIREKKKRTAFKDEMLKKIFN